jgi:membrane-associated phospholipid phosphatase
MYTCLPWAWTLFVAASRLVDQWHHESDVIAGLGLGFATCTVVYHHWYPPIWSFGAGIPRNLLLSTSTTSSTPSSVLRQYSNISIPNDGGGPSKESEMQLLA